MIQARTCGRLGNFLFQFAAVYGHAHKYGFDWAMPLKSMNERLWPTPRFPKIKYSGSQPGTLIQEKSSSFQELPAEDNLILEGYWQSEKYFEHCKDEIASILEFERKETDYVAIHVRRGDYLRFPDEFPVLPLEYYVRALEYVYEKGMKNIMVFSDDLKWCMNTFKIFTELNFSYSDRYYPKEDMRAIFNCKAMIIANSSFSLFPALLRSDNPLVIAPAMHRWFGPKNKHLDSPDRVPERFIQL